MITMRKIFYIVGVATTLLATPALADNFVADCKAGIPADPPPGAVSPDQFCSCADRETANNPAVRSALEASFKIPQMSQRLALLSDPAKAVGAKCSTK
jgi:hypothetical protein